MRDEIVTGIMSAEDRKRLVEEAVQIISDDYVGKDATRQIELTHARSLLSEINLLRSKARKLDRRCIDCGELFYFRTFSGEGDRCPTCGSTSIEPHKD